MSAWRKKIAGGTSAVASVGFAQASSVQLVASNAGRSTYQLIAGGPMYLGFGATAVASVGWPVASGAVWTDPLWNGAVNCIIASAGATYPYWVREIS